MTTWDEVARWLHLQELLDAVTARIRGALRRGDQLEYGRQLCERAWVEMRLRDCWLAGSEQALAWQRHMDADVAAACRAEAGLRGAP